MSLLTPTKLPYENAFSYGNENRRRNSRPRTDTAGHLSVRKLPGEYLRHVLYIERAGQNSLQTKEGVGLSFDEFRAEEWYPLGRVAECQALLRLPGEDLTLA